MKEIIDNEIINALECCNTARTEHRCDICPFYEYERCTVFMLDSAVDLINRQKEEINALNGNTEKYIAECEKRSREITEDYIKEIKSEAIKEFAEELKKRASKSFVSYSGGFEYITAYQFSPETIDTLIKEFTESEGE